MEVEVCVEREGEKEREEKEKSFPKSIKKRIKNQAKINQKSTKKKQKITKKSIKNQSKINLGGVPGGPWRLLAANTEKERGESVFWDPLGAVLAASWGRLGGLGGLLGRLGPSKNRCQNRSKI